MLHLHRLLLIPVVPSLFLATSPWLAPGLPAQASKAAPAPATTSKPAAPKIDTAKLEKDDKEVTARCAAILMDFASAAKLNKVGPRAKEAYDRILSTYDPNHAAARSALGWKKQKDKWVESQPPLEWKDKANDEQRYKVWGEWNNTCRKLANAHKERGLKLIKENSDNPALGVYHLRCAVSYNPFDKEANQALGHEEWKAPDGQTYFGSKEDLVFITKMREVETTALMLAKKEYEVQPIAELPEELKVLDLEMHGAKSKHFTVFTRGSQENADNVAKWGERALEFLEYCLGEQQAKKLNLQQRFRGHAYEAFLWTDTERKQFIAKNPQVFANNEQRENAEKFMNIMWPVKGKGAANLVVRLTPAMMHDYIVANTWTLALQGTNDALAEGAMHAACWYLLATCIYKNGALPDKSETGSQELNLPDSGAWWLREMRDQAQSATDFPVNQLPRVKLSKFSNHARLKTWSFTTWLIARYPDRWLTFVRNVPADKQPFPEEIDDLAAKTFERSLGEIEAEWREWAAGRGTCAAATGYGPPILPEKPNAHEIAGIKRLNEHRKFLGMEPCEIDAESSQACEAHAHFLNLHPEFLKWPDAHEENPALEGFTPRGMRAGLQGVIVWGTDDAAESVDVWIQSFYHRLPLLMPNIRRIGFAVEGKIIVLDMGSLEEPFDPEKSPKRWHYPGKDQKDVAVTFLGHEHPNPVEEVAPKDKQDNTTLGNPITVQLSRGMATSVKDGAITLYEVKRGAEDYNENRASEPPRGKGYVEVPCYVHTPLKPLLKRHEHKDCLCAIPVEHLKPRTQYLVYVRLHGEGEEKLAWRFTTGDR